MYGEKLSTYIFDDSGEVRRNVTLLVNGESVESLQLQSILLNDGDNMAMFPPVGGGTLT